MKKAFLSAILLFLFAVVAQAQEITVSGTVLSGTDGEPLIGATVRCPSTNVGTSTDIDGNFTFKAPRGADLQVSYIGYDPVVVKAEP